MAGENTIQDAIDRGESIRVYCNVCQHNALLDLLALRDKFGPGFSILRKDLAPRLRCAACDPSSPRNVSLICTPGTREYGGNPYTKAKDGGR